VYANTVGTFQVSSNHNSQPSACKQHETNVNSTKYNNIIYIHNTLSNNNEEEEEEQMMIIK
jgi:hypothetical protein